ncbi:MAG: N-acetyl-gamma-glutamyl-phosphate reductase [Bdellovibrionales bacterium RBG_16_40_8]|nr:MAG: N-acetyl-gamma-glutamyl-phosphate reductase [Bdellovibrionales bacterium RBG_16_40_8]
MTCSIVGARGYVGLELARLLLHHPRAALTHCFATSEFKLANYLSSKNATRVECLPDSEIFNYLTDVVFLATPAEVSLQLVPKIIAQGKKVIDLSGAFRLKKNDYLAWYGFEHTEKKILAKAQYGLSPWAGPSTGMLIANPGCYATAITLALIPALKNGLINENNIVIDAKSGTTGAGKKASENLLFTEVDGECLPYKVGRHQHYPEIVEAIEVVTNKKIEAHMTTSLLPVRRGIIAGIYSQLHNKKTIKDVEAAFAEAYREYSLISYGNLEASPKLLSLKNVVGTARAHISYKVDGQKLYLFSCIDNLLKGAASQAIENFNRISDLPISTGVSHLEALT